jgi:deoxycytidine triphosphate deaminase
MFKMLDEPTERPYRGKYQNQPSGPQPAILEPELPFFD